MHAPLRFGQLKNYANFRKWSVLDVIPQNGHKLPPVFRGQVFKIAIVTNSFPKQSTVEVVFLQLIRNYANQV